MFYLLSFIAVLLPTASRATAAEQERAALDRTGIKYCLPFTLDCLLAPPSYFLNRFIYLIYLLPPSCRLSYGLQSTAALTVD